MKIQYPLLLFKNGCLYVIALLFAACSKKNDDRLPTFNYDEQRIASITIKDEARTATFTYDDQKRLNRIDYNYDDNSSVRFGYNGQTITAQYYKGAAPNPQREKYTFTLLNGRVVNNRMNQPNGNYYDTYYDYDTEGRMVEIGFRGISPGGSLFASADCYISYDAQNNAQTLKLYGQYQNKATDTIVQTRIYSTDRLFFNFHNVGFNYFGTTATGFAHSIQGLLSTIEPFPFIRSGRFIAYGSVPYLIPAPSALKTLRGTYKWLDRLGNIFNPQWVEGGWDWTDPEDNTSPYKYDDKGRLISYYNYSFTWQ